MLHGSAVAVEPQRVSVATGGYHEEALRVAKVSRRHGKVVDICLHHVAGGAGGAEALAYIATLGRAEQEALLVQHGKALVSRFKLEMQARLKLCAALCTTATSRTVHNDAQLCSRVKLEMQAACLGACAAPCCGLAFVRHAVLCANDHYSCSPLCSVS